MRTDELKAIVPPKMEKIQCINDKNSRWLLTLYTGKELLITDEEKNFIAEEVKKQESNSKRIIDLGRAFFTINSISSIIYRGVYDNNWKLWNSNKD